MSALMRWSLATLSGCLNGAAFVYYGPLALIANVPLLWAIPSAQSRREGAALGAWVGFLGGVHIFGVLSYGWWIFWAFSAYTASQMTLFGWVVGRAYERLRGSTGPVRGWRAHHLVLTPALIWTLTEWLRTVGPVALPASYVGCIADVPWLRGLLSWSSAGGGLLVSALIAWVCSGLAALSSGLIPGRARSAVSLSASLTPIMSCGALWLIGTLLAPPPQGERLTVAALQGGFSNAHYRAAEADPAMSREIVRTYTELLRRARSAQSALVIWAESAVRAPLLSTPALQGLLFPRADEAFTLIGGLAHTDPDGRSYNLAISAERGRLVDRYAKVKTVPGVEARFTPGERWRALDTQRGKLGVLICFESIYPHAGRALARDGARLLIVLSNDAGFGETPISRHMNNRAVVRAVELGRWLVRVGQAGVTSIVSPSGALVSQLGLFEAGLLTGEVELLDHQTPYVRWGLWWLWLCALGLTPVFGHVTLTAGEGIKLKS